MLPPFRAAADRLIFDVANLRYLLDALSGAGLDARLASTGWTVRETIAHLAEAEERHAAGLESLLMGGPLRPPGYARDEANAGSVARHRLTGPSELIALYASARDRTIAALRRFTANAAVPGLEGVRLSTVVAGWVAHPASHMLEVLEAAPELLTDGFILNWALVPQGEPTAKWLDRRNALLDEAQHRIAALPPAKEEKE